ncbi:MAG: ribosome maturation factor RimP [Coriobacteriia bacterium]|nr:ribosome maturation factor RimP [Coriobacteriia bacterium]
MAQDLAGRLAETLDALAGRHGYELVAVEAAGGGAGGGPVVRVFLDREGGIDLDAIAEANRWVAPAVDEVLPGAYTLEISSPGIDRPLVKPADFERFAGKVAAVKTARPIEGRANFTGTLLGMDGGDVLLEIDGTTYRLPHSAIAKARLKAEIDFGEEGAGCR